MVGLLPILKRYTKKMNAQNMVILKNRSQHDLTIAMVRSYLGKLKSLKIAQNMLRPLPNFVKSNQERKQIHKSSVV